MIEMKHEGERVKEILSTFHQRQGELELQNSDKLRPTRLTKPLFSQLMTSNVLTGLMWERRIIWGQGAIYGGTTTFTFFPGPRKQTCRPKVVLHMQNQRCDLSIALVVLVAGLIISIGRHIRLDLGHFWAQPHCCD